MSPGKKNLFFILCFLFCFFVFLPSPSFAEDKPIGKIIAITGTVEFMAGGAEAPKDGTGVIRPVAYVPWEKVKFQQPVYAKDQFRTKKRSRLKILFLDNSLMALGPNSAMSVKSYLVKPDEKLRQGVINVAHGLSMYIVNKGQKNKKSSFKIVSPTANLAARGTQGYISSSPGRTLLANQTGAMAASSNAPGVAGEAVVGKMQKTVIPAGKPPAAPAPLTKNELNMIRGAVVGQVGGSVSGSASSLVQVEEKAEETEEEESEESSDESSDSETTSEESTSSEESSDSEESSEKSSEESKDTADSEEGGKEEGGGDEKADAEGGKKEGGEKSDSGEGSEGGDKAEAGGDKGSDKGGSESAEAGGDKAEAGGEGRGGDSGGDRGGDPAGGETAGGDTGGGGDASPGGDSPGMTADSGGRASDQGGMADSGSPAGGDMGGSGPAADTGPAPGGDMGGTMASGGDFSAPAPGGDFGGGMPGGDVGGGMDFGGGFADVFVADVGGFDAGASVGDFMPTNNPFDAGSGGCSP